MYYIMVSLRAIKDVMKLNWFCLRMFYLEVKEEVNKTDFKII